MWAQLGAMLAQLGAMLAQLGAMLAYADPSRATRSEKLEKKGRTKNTVKSWTFWRYPVQCGLRRLGAMLAYLEGYVGRSWGLCRPISRLLCRPMLTHVEPKDPKNGARGRRWGRGCLSRGRRSTQSLLEELRRAWSPLGPRLPFAWQAQYTDLLLRPAWPPLGPRLPFIPLITAPLITSQLLITTHHNLSHTNSSQLHFSHLTHHSSTAHHISSQLHFSQVHFSSLLTGPLLITTHHIPTHHSSTSHTSLLTPHLSHHNFSSQLITTYHIPTHHSSTSHTTSHTSLITSELITAPLLTPDIASPLLTPHFSHLPEVHIKLRYIRAWHVGLSGPFIYRQTVFTQRKFSARKSPYAQKVLHTAFFEYRRFYTQMSLHRHQLHTETCAHSTRLHTANFYTERFCFPFLLTYLSCSPSSVFFDPLFVCTYAYMYINFY